MLICAYYTKDTPYAGIVKNLEESLIALGLSYRIDAYDNRGSWVENCAIKPEFLLDCLSATDEDILYVDADAIVRKVPEIVCDEAIGVYYRPHPGGVMELLSGTIYLKQTAKPIVVAWLQEQQRNPGVWDQKTLATVVADTPVYHLPQGYTKIFDAAWVDNAESVVYIEHYQASRKNKNLINSGIQALPDCIGTVRIRKMIDGSFTIARKNKDLEARFDAKYVRVPNELRWFPYCADGMLISDIAKAFQGKACYVVGKGPSLDKLTKDSFPDTEAPVVCINQSIHAIEQLDLPNPMFCIQQDMSIKNECRPKYATLLVAYAARHWYEDVDNKVVFHMEEFGLKSCLTVIVAMRLSQRSGCTALRLLAFDAATNGSTAYATVIGHAPTRGGKPERFLEHKRLIDAEAKVPVYYG